MNNHVKFLKYQLLFLDLILLVISFLVVSFFRIESLPTQLIMSLGFWFILFVCLCFQYVFGAYELESQLKSKDIFIRSLFSVLCSFIFIIIVNYAATKDRSGIFGRGILLGSLFVFLFFGFFIRRIFWSKSSALGEKLKWLVFGDSSFVDPFYKDWQQYGFSGDFSFIINERSQSIFLKDNSKVVGTLDSLHEQLTKQWSGIIMALQPQKLTTEIGQQLMDARFRGVRVHDLESFYDSAWEKVPLYFLNQHWFVLSDGFNLLHNPIGLRVKRLLDLILSFGLLLVVWPFMLLTAIAIKIESKGPAIYSQIRSGKDDKNFKIYKFRSMRADAEAGGAQWAQKNDNRITKVGSFIRKTRLDELPQLYNVLTGDMSFIGPRPERPEFNEKLEKEIAFYNLRHLVRPGITGWAQVMYPYGASIEDAKEKLQYDLYYIRHHSLLFDLKIVIRTIRVVLFGKGR